MIAALRYEWMRLTTIRSTKLALAFALVISTGLGWLIAAPSTMYDEFGNVVGEEAGDWYGAFGFPLTLTAVVASVIASQAIGQEYRFGIIRLTLTAFPQRARILTAKLAVVVLAAVAIGLLSYLGSYLGVVLRGYPSPPDGVTPVDSTYFLRGIVFVVLWSLASFALAGIVRQTAVGIAVPIISGLIVENILQFVLFERAEWLARILPWSTASRWSAATDPTGENVLAVGWAALGIFSVWVVAFLILEVVAFLRRDA
ncbi:ABC transporter permease [Longivirga aurantiaca]|uniref:ABC transporter permease n=1 Tax=Longivirga aurantiaca TaxID=1837743 RepID=A0ABW1SYK7_9ACTN